VRFTATEIVSLVELNIITVEEARKLLLLDK
jgi:hypothetical protein